MEFYIFMAIMPFVVSLFFKEINKSEKQKKIYCVICGIILILLLGVRSRFIGSTDTLHYYNLMKSAINSTSWESFYMKDYVEKGFQFFVWLISRFFKDPQWIIAISSAIYTTCISVFIYRYSKNVCLSFTMYICLGLMTFSMQGMRQAIAIGICLLAYDFAKKKKLIPFVVMVFLAWCFHQTAIVFLVVYPLVFIKLKPSHIMMVIAGIVVAVLLSDRLISSANDLFGKNYKGAIDTGGFVATAIYVLIIVFSIYVAKRPIRNNIDTLIFFMLIVGFVCYIERYIGVLIAERISFYFVASQMILLPNAIAEGRIVKKDLWLVNGMVYCLCIALFIYRLQGSDLLPFEFFWQL